MKLSGLWNSEDFERGLLWASLVSIIYYTIFASPDYDLWVEHIHNISVPYGVLWTWLNPFFWTTTLYTSIVVVEWGMVTFGEWMLARRKIIPLKLVKLQVFTVAILLTLHSTQNITVIMFAPLAALYPVMTLLLIFQK